MKLTKRDVQKRVLKDGKPLDLKLFDWDIKTRTFKSSINGLVIDFTGIDSVKFKTRYACIFKTGRNCMFNTGNYCTFNTGHSCTFNTGSDCTFSTGSGCMFKTSYSCTFDTKSDCTFNTGTDCTFNTGDDCTFDTGFDCTFATGSDCVFNTGYRCTFVTGSECTFVTGSECTFNTGTDCLIRNKSNNEVITPPVGVKLITCPLFIPGYLIGSDYYVNGVKQDGEYMVVDGILSKILSKKGNIYKVNNYNINGSFDFNKEITYIVQDGDIFAHGDTIEEARESLIYKIGNRDTSVYDSLTIDSMLTKEEAIKMYRVITGSCEYGVRNFVESLPEVKDKYTVQEIIELTTGQYGNNVLRDFFKI